MWRETKPHGRRIPQAERVSDSPTWHTELVVDDQGTNPGVHRVLQRGLTVAVQQRHISAVVQQDFHDLVVGVTAGFNEGRPTEIIAQVDLGTLAQQVGDESFVADTGSFDQSGPTGLSRRHTPRKWLIQDCRKGVQRLTSER